MSTSSARDDFDARTGLYNGQYFGRALAEAVVRAHRNSRPLGLIVFDIDDLKSVNDRFGHAAGNEVLAGVAERVREVLGSADIACRIGGDEFAILLPESTREGAMRFYSRLDTAVGARPIGWGGRVTFSVGIVGLEPGENVHSLLLRADDALYHAKGREGQVVAIGSALSGRRPTGIDPSRAVDVERWEYWIEEGEPAGDSLNELGAEGWELAGVVGARLIFKRRADEQPPSESSGVREPRRPKPSTGSEPVRRPLPDDQS